MQNSNEHIENISFSDAISERYLSYALSTIMSRSLPDVRDGLKPVHRRLLYAMMQLQLNPNSAYKKSARIVGDVIGKYHPHGDTAVYDTLVRLAQGFALRYPLIDGQGNFGSVDGDNAAAMRYTESRMTEICALLISDIDKDTVDFTPTYDDSELEPILMPTAFPNLLANGSEGIAVGMATNIPPHNLYELCGALIFLIDQPIASTEEILRYIKGPDFPTGGIIVDNYELIHQIYNTGKGSIKVRAKWHKENLKSGLYQIIISEIPYQVQKSKLIENIANLLKDKKIPLINNIRDESAEQIRIVIEPKTRNCDPVIIMESLFKLTTLENRVQINMNVLDSNKLPKVMSLLEILHEFLKHRRVIVTRRSRFLLNKTKHKIEILEGLKIAYLNLDEIIKIVRTEDHPKKIIMHNFSLSEVQAEAILNTKLRSLHKLEETEIMSELAELSIKQQELIEILENPKQLETVLKNEIKIIQNQFTLDTKLGARRTIFETVEHIPQITDISAFIEKEPITIFCSKMGWVWSIKGHSNDFSNIKYKEGDGENIVLETYTTDKILICSSSGKLFTILADVIPKSRNNAESIKLIVEIGNDDIVNMLVYKPNQKLLLASNNGKGFITYSNDIIASTKLGKKVMNTASNYDCTFFLPIDNEDLIACVGENRKMLIFSLEEIPIMKSGQGVILQSFKAAKLSDIKFFNSANGLQWNLGTKVRVEKDLMQWRGKRGGTGKIPPVGFPKNNKF